MKRNNFLLSLSAMMMVAMVGMSAQIPIGNYK